MKSVVMVFVLLFTSCATVVKPQNFTLNEIEDLPENKKSLSVTVFQKLYDEEGEFFGYGYRKDLTQMFVREFKKTKAFTKVSVMSSTCSDSYACLDVPTSKKLQRQRHVNIILPKDEISKDYSFFTTALSVVTLGLYPASYDLIAPWEVSMVNKKREELYIDDTVYKAAVKKSVLNQLNEDKIEGRYSVALKDFYKKVAVRVVNNIIFQIKRFP